MTTPDDLPPLCDVLRAKAESWRSASHDSRESDWNQGCANGCDDAANLAAPYDARMKLLEEIRAENNESLAAQATRIAELEEDCAESIASYYKLGEVTDAEIERLRAELEPFRELARDAHALDRSIVQAYDTGFAAIVRIFDRLAALHRPEDPAS